MNQTVSLGEKEYQLLQEMLDLMNEYGSITVEELRTKLGPPKQPLGSTKWMKVGDNSVYRKIKRGKLRGTGKNASEILIENRKQ